MSALHSTQVLIEAVSVASVAAVSFGSTNLDNLAIVSAYAAKSGYRRLFVKLTFILVCLAVLLVSLALAQAADALTKDKIRYLGLIPMGIGGYHLAKLIKRRSSADSWRPDAPSGPIGVAGYVGLASALLANSGDSVIVMTPLLADLEPSFVIGCFAAAVAMALLMSMLAGLVAGHAAWSVKVEKISEWALPFILVGIGALIIVS